RAPIISSPLRRPNPPPLMPMILRSFGGASVALGASCARSTSLGCPPRPGTWDLVAACNATLERFCDGRRPCSRAHLGEARGEPACWSYFFYLLSGARPREDHDEDTPAMDALPGRRAMNFEISPSI